MVPLIGGRLVVSRALSQWRPAFQPHADQGAAAVTRSRAFDAVGDDAPVSFSGAGWLLPFHIGVADVLISTGHLTPTSRLAGASGGALVAAGLTAGVSPDGMMDATLRLAATCRRDGTLWRTLGPLQQALREVLPDGVAQVATERRTTIAVTRAWPSPQRQPVLLDAFHDDEDFRDAVVASCYIPSYLAASPVFPYCGGYYVDGGLTKLIPPVPGALRVNVLPSSALPRRHQGHISADDAIALALRRGGGTDTPAGCHFFGGGSGVPLLLRLLRHCLDPGSDDTLALLREMGRAAAHNWVGVQAGSAR